MARFNECNGVYAVVEDAEEGAGVNLRPDRPIPIDGWQVDRTSYDDLVERLKNEDVDRKRLERCEEGDE